MLRLGVRSVLSKADDLGHLISAIDAVFEGAAYISPSLRPSGISDPQCNDWKRG
jgi:two-component system capsular synthesis response regulator RcsB